VSNLISKKKIAINRKKSRKIDLVDCDFFPNEKIDLNRSIALRSRCEHNVNTACWLSLWPQASKESEWHPGQMPRLLLERGISLNLRVSGRRGKVKTKNGVIVIFRAGLETLRAL